MSGSQTQLNQTVQQPIFNTSFAESSPTLISDDNCVSWPRYFIACFGNLPNRKICPGINCIKLAQWVEVNFSNRILRRYTEEMYIRKKKCIKPDDLVYIIQGGLIIILDVMCDVGQILFAENNDEADWVMAKMRSCLKKGSPSRISLVVVDRDGLALKCLSIKRQSLRLELNYNEDLVQLHPTFCEALKAENKGGLMLFHGEPGTGKSTYIRYLTRFTRKEVIFLSPRIAGNLDEPGFVKLLTENPNSVIVIEDAEDLLLSREAGHNSGISTLLNLTDGLLGAGLGIQFICTFNTSVRNIDKAILRKGRLLGLYEFGPLAVDKANTLLNHLGTSDFMISQPMTVANVYNLSQPEYEVEPKRKSIGFKVA
jgi:hypothetical protein